jgi:hypothetical protein
MKRKCPNCDLHYEKYKKKCRNEKCLMSNEYKKIKNKIYREYNKKKKEKRKSHLKEIRNMAKKMIKKIKGKKKDKKKDIKLYRGDARQTMKGRAGSTRNGFNRSIGALRSPNITEKEVKDRDILLNVDYKICFWCKDQEATDLDHILPACSTRHNIYSYTNKLCLFPACKTCNSKLKCGKIWEAWKKVLVEKFSNIWSEENILIVEGWINKNLNKLIFNEKNIKYVNKQHQHINDFHAVGEYCAEYGLDIKEELMKKWNSEK